MGTWAYGKVASWPAYGKEGRAWVRSFPDPDDKGWDPQCFVCGKTLWQHPKIQLPATKAEKKAGHASHWQHEYCRIPKSNPEMFCDEKDLWSSWARMNNRLYKSMAQNEALWEREQVRLRAPHTHIA